MLKCLCFPERAVCWKTSRRVKWNIGDHFKLAFRQGFGASAMPPYRRRQESRDTPKTKFISQSPASRLAHSHKWPRKQRIYMKKMLTAFGQKAFCGINFYKKKIDLFMINRLKKNCNKHDKLNIIYDNVFNYTTHWKS